jgi:hypothetical protein
VGEDLWHLQGHAKPQRPKAGWGLVVHSQGPKERRLPTFVSMPNGRQRPLSSSEAFFERVRTAKKNVSFTPK